MYDEQESNADYNEDPTPDYERWEIEQVFQDQCRERDDYTFADDPDTFENKDGEWTCEFCGQINSTDDPDCQWCEGDVPETDMYPEPQGWTDNF